MQNIRLARRVGPDHDGQRPERQLRVGQGAEVPHGQTEYPVVQASRPSWNGRADDDPGIELVGARRTVPETGLSAAQFPT
ncbi:hypothetical protein GCM10017668_54770 [Streptomyces tuirus]|uniref:Uncharacterized protein n=1 Tax=Streptomyces tuirus TaxID=68278 RepID=A0A7G1NPH2_9ACTN|nr:hypothetical protein GCM10017668_54770 [Streptomyces tuirus]